jgi:hypothetical protein
LLIIIIPLAIFLADFFSGVVHIFFDYFPINRKAGFHELFSFQGDRSSPEYLSLKKRVITHPATSIIDRLSYSFKIHHVSPLAMNRKSYSVHMLETVVPASLIALLSITLPSSARLTMLITAFLIANVQFIHACVHDTHRSVFWKIIIHQLQRLYVIYSLDTHMQHHRYGTSNFCLVTGWANFALNPLFRLLLLLKLIDTSNWVSLKELRFPKT